MTGMLVLLAVVIACGLLFHFGWHWKRMSIPARCRRCGYDVSHRPEGVQTCSECGADLSGSRAVIDVRHRPDWWIVLPAGMIGVFATAMLVNLANEFQWTGWYYRNAPIWWVAYVARHSTGNAEYRHATVWYERDGQSAAYCDYQLERQGSARGQSRFDPWLLNAYLKGRLSSAQKDRFIRQSFADPAGVKARTTVRQGDPLPLAILPTPHGYGTDVCIRYRIAASVDPPPAATPEFRYRGSEDISGNPLLFTIGPRDWDGGDLPLGKHKLHVVVAREFAPRGGELDSPALSPSVDCAFDVDLEVLPRGAAIGQPIDDPSLAASITANLMLEVGREGDRRISLALCQPFGITVDESFVVDALLNGKSVRVGEYRAAAGTHQQIMERRQIPVSPEDAAQAETITLIFTGDGDPLRNAADQNSYWNGRIVYPDVPIKSWDAVEPKAFRGGAATLPYRIESKP
jgi:hypothetical protein